MWETSCVYSNAFFFRLLLQISCTQPSHLRDLSSLHGLFEAEELCEELILTTGSCPDLEWTQVLTIESPAAYHWTILLSQCVGKRENGYQTVSRKTSITTVFKRPENQWLCNTCTCDVSLWNKYGSNTGWPWCTGLPVPALIEVSCLLSALHNHRSSTCLR